MKFRLMMLMTLLVSVALVTACNKSEEKASSAADAVEQAADDAGHDVADAVDDAGDAASDAISDMDNEATDAADDMADDAVDAADGAVDAADGMVDDATDAAGDMADDAMDTAKDKAGDMADDANPWVQFLKESEISAWVGIVVIVLSKFWILIVCRATSITSPSAPYFGISTQSPIFTMSLLVICRLATTDRIVSRKMRSSTADMAPMPLTKIQGDLSSRIEVIDRHATT